MLPRERLFARLDECRQQAAAVWICGPPGAGKTTLAASYLQARGLHALWYRVDAGDADPASFFYHLSLGAKQACKSRRLQLPLLTPQDRAGLGGFSKRFFRILFRAVPRSCLLVLDNIQDVPESSSFAEVLREGLSELPPGLDAVLISRSEPAPALARLRASRQLAELGWDELRLTEAEAERIAAGAAGLRGDDASRLAERCGGWAAGLTLLLDHALATGALAESPRSRQAMFDYFAAELFDRQAPRVKHLLLRTALLPWFSVEMARAVSGRPEAGVLLEGLRRRHLFVERRNGPVASYQYHALFREFLEDRVEKAKSRQKHLRLACDSAMLLAASGQTDAALRLLLAAGKVDDAVRIVLDDAAGLVAQGRLQTLATRIGALPRGTLQRWPWLGYWLGVCELGIDPVAARLELEAAFHRFEAAGDLVGQAVGAAAIIGSHSLEFRNYALLEPWTLRLQRVLDTRPAFADPALELGAYGALLGALVMRMPERELLEPFAVRARALLERVPDVNSRVAGAIRLLHYYSLIPNLIAGDQLVACLRPDLTDPRLAAHIHCQWLHFESFWFQMNRYDASRAAQAIDRALEVIDSHDLKPFAIFFRARAAHLRLDMGDTEGAARHLSQAVPALAEGNAAAWHSGMQSWVSLLRCDSRAAVGQAEVLVRECAKAGTHHGYGISLLLQANARAASGDDAGALHSLQLARVTHLMRSPIGPVTADCIEADMHLRSDRAAEAECLVRDALALARAEQVFNTLQWLAPQMSRVCAFALEHGIEAGYVRQLIRLRGLRPPSADTPAWPWPIELRTLGRFEIRKDGERLQVEGKTQRKPMALVKTLVALGGIGVPEDRLIDILWADSLDGGGQKALDVTLHRLRKLLGHDNAVQVTDRQVSLNPEIVCVDLWVLERQLATMMPMVPARDGNAHQLELMAAAILDLHRGPFLEGEPDTAWVLPVRNRVASRWRAFVGRLGEHWEATAEWARAVELYRRAVELDPLAESFYRRHMVCLRKLGQHSEAIDVFRRCRQMLSVTLGIQPTASTEAVYRELFER
jgi:DNA-binding SARP family transcriptional activator